MKDVREEYGARPLTEEALLENPLGLLQQWVDEAIAGELPLPNAMTLSTVDTEGFPSSRIVLLKGIEQGGLTFFTHYDSRKGREIADNPRVSVNFFWEPYARQVMVRGRAEVIAVEESRAYFRSRPRASQISALISPQSRPASRRWLQEQVAEAEHRFQGRDIPCPEQWGGYRIFPEELQFWHGRPSRLHDRFRYLRESSGGWQVERLAP